MVKRKLQKALALLLFIILGRKYRTSLILAKSGMVVHVDRKTLTAHEKGVTCSICCEHCNLPFDPERFTIWSEERPNKEDK